MTSVIIILSCLIYFNILNSFQCANIQLTPSFECSGGNSGAIPNVNISLHIAFDGSGQSSGGTRLLETKDCGVTLPRNKLLGQSDSYEGEFPWFVSIYKANFQRMSYECDGTLISKSTVITSGVCITVGSPVKPESLWVYIGAYNFIKATANQQHRPVKSIVFHPNYDYSTLESDVALLKLVSNVDVTDYVRPVCLWPDSRPIETLYGYEGEMPGWGYDEEDYVTEELSFIPSIVVPKEKCIIRRAGLNNLRTSSASLFCGGFRPKSQLCKGDDGSGLFFKINGISYIRGFASCSIGYQDELLCDANHFVGFTDIVTFLPWIKEHM